MSNFKVPADLRYTREHEWARRDGDTIVIGITDYAQDALGDITFLELPEVGRSLAAAETFGVVESVKTYSDLYAPIAGEVVETNVAAVDDPAAINTDPYSVWLIRIAPSDAASFDGLMSAAEYDALVDSVG